MQSPSQVSDLMRTLSVILLISVLLLGCAWVLRPFLPGLLWGAMVAVASWPLMLRVQAWLGGRRGLAAAIMVIGLTLAVVMPIVLAVTTVIDNGGELLAWLGSLRDGPLAVAPDWVAQLPYVGPRAVAEWQRFLGTGPGAFGTRVSEHGQEITSWFFAQVGGVGALLLRFTIAMAAAALLFVKGEQASAFLRRLLRRLVGKQSADEFLALTYQSISAVAMGIVVTAMVQALVGGLGMLITGVPFVAVLTSVMLMLCLVQIGPTPILVPVVIWMFWQGNTWQAIVLIVFTVVCVTLDNVLRPMLIQRGANIPLLLCLVGSIGGLIAFGLLGLFVGPVILALGLTLLRAWMKDPTPAQVPTE